MHVGGQGDAWGAAALRYRAAEPDLRPADPDIHGATAGWHLAAGAGVAERPGAPVEEAEEGGTAAEAAPAPATFAAPPSTPLAFQDAAKGQQPKGKAKGKPMGRKRPAALEGKAQRWKGKPICWDYNTTGCDKAADGGECPYGLHVCCQQDCGKAHPLGAHR